MRTEQPLFTVATITYNSGKWVRQAIESVLASSFTDFEYLISDDCSTDDTWNVIQQYKDSRIRAWRNEENMGEYPNRNKVLAQARGKFIFYLDGDDILYKNALSTFAGYIEAFPEADSIWGCFPYDFAVYPCLFTPLEMTQLLFFTNYPISIIGFTETLFKVSMLKELGGLPEQYRSGDTYIKRKLASTYPVLLTSLGYSFWRQSEGQASKKLTLQYTNLKEAYSQNKEIILSSQFPLSSDRETLLLNNRISFVKLLFINTVLKGKVIDFFSQLRSVGFSWRTIFLLTRKIQRRSVKDILKQVPDMNSFNFK